jgi:hypothetical protein
MPKRPRGEKRPGDVIGNAVHVMRIATGEVEDVKQTPDPAKEYMRRGGLKGGKARAAKLSATKRKAIAKKGAEARWAKAPTS